MGLQPVPKCRLAYYCAHEPGLKQSTTPLTEHVGPDQTAFDDEKMTGNQLQLVSMTRGGRQLAPTKRG